MTEKHEYEGFYLRLANDATFWLVEKGIRRPITYHEFMKLGIKPVRLVSGDTLSAIPTSKDQTFGREVCPVAMLRDAYPDETLYVVGSGPSVLDLDMQDFGGSGPIVTINYAIQQVEPLFAGVDKGRLYSMQKDLCLVKPEYAALLVHKPESGCCFGDYEPQFLFDNETDFDLGWSEPSVVSCVGLAVLMGCSDIVYFCCDGAITGSAEAVHDGELVSPVSGADYARQRVRVDEALEKFDIPAVWLVVGE